MRVNQNLWDFIYPDPFTLMKYVNIVGEYRNIMKHMELVKVKGGGMPTDSAQTSSDDLTFSGRVYIYHEDDLSLQQLAALERLYNSKGLSVSFKATYI